MSLLYPNDIKILNLQLPQFLECFLQASLLSVARDRRLHRVDLCSDTTWQAAWVSMNSRYDGEKASKGPGTKRIKWVWLWILDYLVRKLESSGTEKARETELTQTPLFHLSALCQSLYPPPPFPVSDDKLLKENHLFLLHISHQTAICDQDQIQILCCEGKTIITPKCQYWSQQTGTTNLPSKFEYIP